MAGLVTELKHTQPQIKKNSIQNKSDKVNEVHNIDAKKLLFFWKTI